MPAGVGSSVAVLKHAAAHSMRQVRPRPSARGSPHSAPSLVEAQSAPGHDTGAVCHDGHAMQRGLAVEQHHVAVCNRGAR